MIENVLENIYKYKMIEKGDRVTAALSGGADSVCLLLCLSELKEKLGITLEVVHINHNIRGAESDSDENFCKKLCRELNLNLKVISVNIPDIAKSSGKSLEETARDVRYQKFSEISGKIATAHTLSDNAETVLLNLIRGTGLKGLCGIPPVRDNIIRPLIGVTREQVEDYLKNKNQEYVTDSTNLSDDYTRNKIRHKIIPVMTEINKGFYKSFSNSLKAISEENELLEAAADEYYTKNYHNGKLSNDTKVHDLIKKRAVSMFLKNNNLPISFDKINETAKLLNENGALNIKKDTYIRGIDGNIFVEKKMPEFSEIQAPFKIGENRLFENIILIAKKANNKNNRNVIDLDKVQGNIILRNRRYGDKIKLSGNNFTSSVKKLLNEKVSPDKRSFIHFLQDDNGLIFMENFGVSERVKADKNSVNTIEIIIQRMLG